MPLLSELRLNNFRNIDSALLVPNPSFNIFYGDNGSGKTSLLEAISVVAHGRSFRTRKFTYLINKKTSDFTVFGKTKSDLESDERNVGVQRGRQGLSLIKVDGEKVSSALTLARCFPVLVLDSHAFQLLEGSSKERRHFFDWLVFHVKHDFGSLWKEYSKCIKQRNTLLRHGNIGYRDIEPWDIEIAGLALQIEDARAACFALFKPALIEYLEQCEFPDYEVELVYRSGWKFDTDQLGRVSLTEYQEALKESFEKDKILGYTSVGSHKNDLSLSVDRKKISEVFSRGQQKLLITAMYLALASTLYSESRERTVFLLDDLPAELDELRLALLGKWLNNLELQVFVTSVDSEVLTGTWGFLNKKNCAMFHVKHGDIEIR